MWGGTFDPTLLGPGPGLGEGSLGPSASVLFTLAHARPFCPHRLCGTYPPSYNLTFLSSQNVLLVTLIINTERRHPGFEATFFQLPKMSSKEGRGGVAKGTAVSVWPGSRQPRTTPCGELAPVRARGLKLKSQGHLPFTLPKAVSTRSSQQVAVEPPVPACPPGPAP